MVKLNIQLFPMDEFTLKELEKAIPCLMLISVSLTFHAQICNYVWPLRAIYLFYIPMQDGHNPHLELTLKARKMISLLLRHLMQKWGHSTAASGELMLFLYIAQWKDLPRCQS